jgi:hypothetical protein
VQHVYNIDMVYLAFKYLKYFTYVSAINVCSISMHHMYVPHMCMYQLCESAINLYHLYVPHMYVPTVCSIYIYAQYVRSINNYAPYIHGICMCYAYECLCICMWYMWNWNMLVLCVICMSIQAPFVCAPFVNMAHVLTHKDNTCSTYKTYEMAILIVHIIICYRQFDDKWILHATHRWSNPNIFGLYEAI